MHYIKRWCVVHQYGGFNARSKFNYVVLNILYCMNDLSVWPYPAASMLHAVIEKTKQWRVNLTSIYYCLCGTQANSNRNLKKKDKNILHCLTQTCQKKSTINNNWLWRHCTLYMKNDFRQWHFLTPQKGLSSWWPLQVLLNAATPHHSLLCV